MTENIIILKSLSEKTGESNHFAGVTTKAALFSQFFNKDP